MRILYILTFILFTFACQNEKKIENVNLNNIKLFSNINNIAPGVTSANEVKGEFGLPDIIDRDRAKKDSTSKNKFGDNTTFIYTKLGLEIEFETRDLTNSVVKSVKAIKPFDGKSEEGIFIGISKKECLNIVKQKKIKDYNFGRVILLARDSTVEHSVMLIFENDTLIEVSLHYNKN
jgi:hypothetical protein